LDKLRSYWELVGEHVENPLGTSKEHSKNNKKYGKKPIRNRCIMLPLPLCGLCLQFMGAITTK